MTDQAFKTPQRQSVIGIIPILFKVVYNLVRGFWAIFLLIFVSASDQIKIYGIIAIPILVGLALIYSYLYYRNFRFHIDYENQKFVLEKGVFTSNSIRIPFDRIQQVDLKRSILQRLIGVYGFTVDTAGSKGDEIHIHALLEKDARAISDILTKVKTTYTSEIPVEKDYPSAEESTEQESWHYHTSLFTLLKVGLTRSYLRGFLLITIFLSSIYNQLQQGFESQLEEAFEYSETFVENISGSLIFIPVFIVFAVILSILVTVGEVIIKHFNLNIRQPADYLQIEMGLKTNTKVSFQAHRLQVLKITTNPIQKRLNLYEAQFSLASSDNKVGKSKIITPGLAPKTIEQIKYFLYPRQTPSNSRNTKPHRIWMNRRFIIIGLALLAFYVFSYFSFNLENILSLLFVSSLALLVLVPYQYFLYKTIELTIDDDFLIIKQGLWTQQTEVLELFKMEGVSLRQPFWYRRRGLYNLTFHTAGGDLKMRALPKDFLKEINFLLYKVESSQSVWM